MSYAKKSDAAQPGQAPKEAAPRIDYELLPNGDVTRTDKDSTIRIARYFAEGKRLELVEEHQKFRPALVRYLNELEVEISSTIIEGDKPDAAVADIPPCPKPTMQAGDKTPAIVEWYRRHKPAEYRARYGIIGEGTVTKTRTELNERGEKVKVPVVVDALIAHRKTHLTELPQSNSSGSSNYADA